VRVTELLTPHPHGSSSLLNSNRLSVSKLDVVRFKRQSRAEVRIRILSSRCIVSSVVRRRGCGILASARCDASFVSRVGASAGGEIECEAQMCSVVEYLVRHERRHGRRVALRLIVLERPTTGGACTGGRHSRLFYEIVPPEGRTTRKCQQSMNLVRICPDGKELVLEEPVRACRRRML
jgi:hypothetical protein